MKATLLMLGGSHSEVPLILAGKKLGFRVVTTGNRPSDLGHSYSDEYRFGDFSRADEMLQIARELKADFVCSGCNDFAAISAASVAAELGLPGHDSSAISHMIHQKNSFYDFALEAGAPVPRHVSVLTLEEAREVAVGLGFPVIVKPIDLTGGKGVSVAYSLGELDTAWRYSQLLTRQSAVVIQKFIRGSHHAISAFIVDNNIVFSIIDNEHYHTNPHMVGAVSYPSLLSHDVQNAVKKSVSLLLSRQSFADGIFHLQFIVDSDFKHYFIDVCRRPPGDLYIQFVQNATGVDYPEMIVQSCTGLPVKINEIKTPRNVGRLCLMAGQNGRFREVVDLGGPGSIIGRTPLMPTGTMITDNKNQKIEILHVAFQNSEEAYSTMDNPSVQFSVVVD